MITLEITNQENFDSRLLLPKEIKEKWLTALRSGEYTKGTKYLCKNKKYCCLGVLCEIKNEQNSKNNAICYDEEDSILSHNDELFGVLNALGSFNGFFIKIDTLSFYSLAYINDDTETFEEVIEVIEQYF
jgi:hypothetical protein